MRKIFLLLPIILLVFSSCEIDQFLPPRTDKDKDKPDQLDIMFEESADIKLLQVYAHTVINGTIKKVDSLFVGNGTVGYIDEFGITYTDKLVFEDLEKGEIWGIDKPTIKWYDEDSPVPKMAKWNDMVRENRFGIEKYRLTYVPSTNIYADYKAKVTFFSGDDEYTNLKFEYALIDDNTLYFSTNHIIDLTYNTFPPLTSTQVKIEIRNGNYENVVIEGKSLIKINTNLYIPTGIGDNYRYYGSTIDVGNIDSITDKYYAFKFEIM